VGGLRGRRRGVLARHATLLRAAVGDHGGRVFASSGDGFAAVFEHPDDAVDAAVAAQRALATETWPGDLRLRARMGLETGTARERDGSFLGPVPNRAGRINFFDDALKKGGIDGRSQTALSPRLYRGPRGRKPAPVR
jgi:class 3 adenylate cyclase